MKKIILASVFIFLCISVMSCNKAEQNGTGAFSTASGATEASNNDGGRNDDRQVPYSIPFSSTADINDFLEAARGSSAQYDRYVQERALNAAVKQTQAQSIADNIKMNDILVTNSNFTVEEFGATYYLDRSELDLVYKVNGVRYRFIYRYNDSTTQERTAAPVSENIILGTYRVDLYRGDQCFVGEVTADGTNIQIVVYTEDISKVDLSAFDKAGISETE